ncbi:MAG: penicillin acylase family protein [Deltaproteobacteria bacterium]|nr:penicillin acylase family protein [Deltaproteobacteria bacterium]
MRKWLLIVAVIVTVAIVAAAGLGYLWFRHALGKSLPEVSGEITLPGLRQGVEIIRDDYGVPHIYAGNEPDLYFALGYAMAQDRLWQMEFYRRLGEGRLAEVLGRELVKVDRYVRTLSAAGANREIPEELAFVFESFAEGVNAYIDTHRDRLPFEFRLLRYSPEPWKADDYLSIMKVVNWGLSSGWRVDLTAARILEKVGEERLRDAFPVWPGDAPFVVPSETKALSGFSSHGSEAARLVEGLMGFPIGAASNNWVVSGKKSVTGRPILANDPHLELTNPSLFWEVHLVCPGIDVSGVAIPGTPGVSLGHNRHVAWGITNVMVDDVDFYIEKINPRDPRQYWYKDHWEKMRVVKETIRVRGGKPVEMEILLTRHGPIIQDLRGGPAGRAISARWSFPELPQPAEATYLLAKAGNVAEVQEALSLWTTPGQNFVFADTGGNIGYWCCAAIPIRSKGDGLLPVPGWTGEYEWKGYVPFEEKPHLINPETGFIATANNRVAGKDYPYFISRYWEPADRVTRIHQMLTTKGKLSVEDFKRMQQDVYCLSASEMVPKMVEVLERRLTGREARRARDILSRWDFRMTKESVGACLFEVTYRKMMENTFKDELGDALFRDYLETASFPPRAMRKMFEKGSSAWFDDVGTPEKETMEDILARSLAQTLSELKGSLGSDMDRWTWGRIHRLTFEHVLGKKKPLNWIFNLGPFPLGGNNLTVNVSRYPYANPYAPNVGPSVRMIVDLSGLDRSLRVLPTGESGHLGSKHYKDQLGLYLGGGYHPDWTGRKAVEEHSRAVLVLKPPS